LPGYLLALGVGKLVNELSSAQVGWPPPITTQDAAADGAGNGTAALADRSSTQRLFQSAAPELLLAVRQLLAAMFALQRADDPEGFAKVHQQPLSAYYYGLLRTDAQRRRASPRSHNMFASHRTADVCGFLS
jgi:hypothetical protein